MEDEQHPRAALTAREVEILQLVALGLSNRDIAEDLVVAPETVRWYTKQIYSKLGVSGRIQAVNRARQLGLLPDGLPAEAAHAVPGHPSQAMSQARLPIPGTPFIGRRHELAEVRHLLQAVQLLTLTGVGGTGKTRLALRVAEALVAEFADGVSFVDLAPLSNPSLVAQTIANAVGVIENPPEPQAETLKRALAGRELLLVIDNFEHVIEAAPLIADLLASAPRLKALITSREVLRLSGEQEYPVPPLSLPHDASQPALDQSEAISLFVQRAQMHQPRFALTADNAAAIAEICARLDGLPLAIELAAARCKLLPPQAMLARLDRRLTTLTAGSRDAPPRQQTLRHTIDWSYDLLEAGERTLFARLAVFRGGRSLDAIEAICSPDLPLNVFDGLAALLDKNLIQQKEAPRGEPRFVMLETIHEYADERLAASGEADVVHRRFAEYFVQLAEQAEPELRQAEFFRWSLLLEQELNNLRAVLAWSLGEGDPVLGLRLAGALYLFWWAHGYHVEGRSWTKRLLERFEAAPAIHQAKFLLSAGHMAFFDDLDMARSLFTRMRALAREVGDPQLEGFALVFLGYAMLGETEAALAVVEQGIARFRALDFQPGLAQALNVLGEIARFGGKDDLARQAYEECLAVAHQTGETRRIQLTLMNLTLLAQHEGDHARAIDLARQGLRLACEMNNRLEMGRSLTILTGSLGASGQPELAARVLGASEAAFGSMGAFHLPSDQLELDRIIAVVRAELDDATFNAIWAEGRTMSLEQAVAQVLDA